jgi:hypothetical protein
MAESRIIISNDKTTQFNEWYIEVITKTKLLDYYGISGCYIMLPFSYEMWEFIQNYINCIFKKIMPLIWLCDNNECDKFIRNTYQMKPICRPINVETLQIIKSTKPHVCTICEKNTGDYCYIGKTF